MISDHLVGIVGIGMVGGAMLQCLTEAGVRVIPYDKYRPGFDDESIHFSAFVDAEMVFVSVPTLTNADGSQDLEPLHDVLKRLSLMNYSGIVVSKCTTLPGVLTGLSKIYNNLKIVHYPEFLKASTAYEDFKFQPAAVLSGKTAQVLEVAEFLRELFPKLSINIHLEFEETEFVKYAHNCFLPVKVSFNNELHDACMHFGVNYTGIIRSAALMGGIGESHLSVPGPDGRRGWGGPCFLKDTKAFSQHMKNIGCDVKVLDAAIESNKKWRA